MARYAGTNPKVMAVLRAMEKPVSELPPVAAPRGGTELSMLVTDPNTGEIYRRGGGQSVRQKQALEKAVTPDTMKMYAQSEPGESNMFRKALQKLADFDAAYASRVARDMGDNEVSKLFGAQPLRVKLSTKAEKEQATGAKFSNMDNMISNAAELAVATPVLAANVGYRAGFVN